MVMPGSVRFSLTPKEVFRYPTTQKVSSYHEKAGSYHIEASPANKLLKEL